MNPDDKALSELVRRHATRHEAPPSLHASVRTQVALQALRQPQEGAESRRWARCRERFGARWALAG